MKNRWWIDVLIIAGMMLLVFLFCQPLGRNLDEYDEFMYMGSEGAYSNDMDTYYYVRRAKEFTENGFSSITLTSSRTKDPLITSIQSGEDDFLPNLLSALAAFLWYVLKAVGIKVGIYALCMRLSGFFLSLFVIPVYLFLKKRISRIASVVGALAVSLAPPFMKHSFYSFFDTDALLGLFAITLVLSLMDCVLSKERKKQIVYGIITILAAIGLFFTWKVFYVYTIIAVGVCLVGVFVVWVLCGKVKTVTIPKLRVPLIVMGILTIGTIILGGRNLFSTAASMINVGANEFWPDAAHNMSEMAKHKLCETNNLWEMFMSINSDYMSYFGGVVLFTFLLFSIGVSVFHVNKQLRSHREENATEALFLLVAIGVWTLGTAVMVLFGVRFMEFLIIPSALIMAFGFERVRTFIMEEERSRLCKRIVYVCMAGLMYATLVYAFPVLSVCLAGAVLILGFFFSMMKRNRILVGVIALTLFTGVLGSVWLLTSKSTPIVTKTVEYTMQAIRENTSSDTVIADFWDMGYAYQYYANRRTIGDGGTYNGAYFYWLGTMLNTKDAKLSAGIARMLQAGGLDATNIACELCDGKKAGSELLKAILPLSRTEAQTYLKNCGYEDAKVVELLDKSHPIECPDILFVTSYYQLRRLASFDYYNNWDFTGNGKDSSGIILLGNEAVPIPAEGETATCELWNKTNPNRYKVVAKKEEGKIKVYISADNGIPSDLPEIIFMKDGEITERLKVEKAEEGHALISNETMIVSEEIGKLSFAVLPTDLIDSTFVQLYLFGGNGQTSFTKVYESEIPDMISDAGTDFQRRIGTSKTRAYQNGGIVVWRISFD